MIYTVSIIAVFVVFIAAEFVVYSNFQTYKKKCKDLEEMIVKSAAFTAELSDRVDGVEDYVKMIRSETENDKHADYWASVMNYNPFIEKEGEK